MARSLRRCISGPYGSGQLRDDSGSSLQGTYNNCCLSRPFHCRLLSSGQQHWKHRLSSALILVGLLFSFSCIANLFSDYNKQITRSHAIHIIGSYGEHMLLLKCCLLAGALFFPKAWLCLSEKWWYGDCLLYKLWLSFVRHLGLSLDWSQISPLIKLFSTLAEQGETENACLKMLTCLSFVWGW